jgi:hypothetical protein
MTHPIEGLGRWVLSQLPHDPRERIDQPFTLEGHISGAYTSEMSLASGSVNFIIRPQPNEIYYIRRINIRAYDLAFNDGDVYGSAGLLATGIALVLYDETLDVPVHNFTPDRIRAIHDWGLYAGVDSVATDAALTDTYISRWTFPRGDGDVIVDGSLGHVLRIEIPDDISNLDGQKIMAQGRKVLT